MSRIRLVFLGGTDGSSIELPVDSVEVMPSSISTGMYGITATAVFDTGRRTRWALGDHVPLYVDGVTYRSMVVERSLSNLVIKEDVR